ncbi:hypothetical protein AQI88_35715 [Streptomyces cellostaticus]|uniref:Uncharacterized protein n=1 Tax=Streptomyces cellostaticus TaxID=67285 RepID=A0A124HBL5_9ACTN|nr:hypothetical protein [Streptomyces cellostaticus]KUM91611.1 hypothetical protein AQI88_35715 [Streptomyces cellostaticus]GHI03605.1 hypothetical protein Scel_19260 [Streptomyces cellostaticus]
MNTSGTGTAPTPVEERLRAALAARAQSVGPADLRPLHPPAGSARPRRAHLRRVAVGLLALAAVAALVFFVTLRSAPARPAEPAHSPRPTTSTPSPVPSPIHPTTAEPSPSSPKP